MNESAVDIDAVHDATLHDLPSLALTIALAMAWPPHDGPTRRAPLHWLLNALATAGFLPLAVTHVLAGWLAQRVHAGLIARTADRHATVVAIRSDYPMWPPYTLVGTAMLTVAVAAGLAIGHAQLPPAAAAVLALALVASTAIALLRSVDNSTRASERVIAQLDARHGPLYTRIVAAARPHLRGRQVVASALLPSLQAKLTTTGLATVAINPRVADLYVRAGMAQHFDGNPNRPVCVFPVSLSSAAKRSADPEART